MQKKSTAVVNPNLGLYLDRTPLDVPRGGLQDGNNFRIQGGKLTNANLGWSRFSGFTLNGQVTYVNTFSFGNGSSVLILGTPTDLYKYNPAGSGSVSYITPTYSVGTAAAAGTAVTGVGSAWLANAKAGDEINFTGAGVRDPAATWFTIQSVNNDLSITLTGSAGTIAAHAYTIRRKFTGSADFVWESDTFVNAQPSSTDKIYLTNGVDPLITWNGTDAEVTSLSALGFTCKTLAVYKNMLIVGNIVQGGTFKPTDMLNSDVATPEAIGAASTGLSGQFKIGGITDKIVKLERLGDYMVIYLKRSIILTNFVGDPLVFVFRVAADGKGINSPRAIAKFPDYHEILGPDALYSFDGASAKPTSNHVWREIVRTADPTRVSKPFTVIDESRGDFIWAVPLTTDPGAGTLSSPPASAIGEHYLETVPNGALRPHSRRSFPFTAAGFFTRTVTVTWDQLTNAWSSYNFRWNDNFFAAAFPLILVGDANGKVWQLNGDQDQAGSALSSFVKFGRTPTVDGDNRGLVTRIMPFTSTVYNNNIKVTANLADFPYGPATIRQTQSFNQLLLEGQYFVPIYRAGRYVDVEVGTDGPAQPWELGGYDVRVVPGGNR